MPDATLAQVIDTLDTRYLFFTGKGGVGKTSTACATAIGLADGGRQVLLVSTDPASNLDEVLEATVGITATTVPGVDRLAALNIDPEKAAAEYRERVVGPYRGVLPNSAIARIEEQLSGACTVEIAAFDHFTGLLADDDIATTYDHIVFDTAPTGHTLRLLALPAAWTTFIGDGTGTSCLGPLSGLVTQQHRYATAVANLSDATKTTVMLVTRPDTASVTEAERTGTELRQLGITAQRLIINGIFAATPGYHDPLAAALDRHSAHALSHLPAGLATLKRTVIPLMVTSPLGIDGLRQLSTPNRPIPGALTEPVTLDHDAATHTFDALIDQIAAHDKGLIMTMGKGGVGKTTIATAVAVALADRGHSVRLTTTDPAAHVTATLGAHTTGITVSRIDPVAETTAYTAEVLATAGHNLADDARAVLTEDLASPCTEEIAVFQAFARTVEQAQTGFIVLDTAPTGHTLLLLDAARSYHRELDRQSGHIPDHVEHLLDRLRDPNQTHILLIALPEATPVHEAAHLQTDLARSGITPTAWIINQSLLASQPTDPLLRARATHETRHLHEVAASHTNRMIVLPHRAEAPVGSADLRDLTSDTLSPTAKERVRH